MTAANGSGSTTVAIVGGTGALGTGIATRLARAGVPIMIGSRDAARGAAAAVALAAATNSRRVDGGDNETAAQSGDVVIVTVPYENQRQTLSSIKAAVAGKIVVDTTVPLVPPKVARVQLPAEGSAARIAASILGSGASLLSAFHNVSAQKLVGNDAVDCDILVFGDDIDARSTLIGLIEKMGLRGIHAGPLDNAVAAEALTSALIGINKRYKVDGGAGIRVTGVGDARR